MAEPVVPVVQPRKKGRNTGLLMVALVILALTGALVFLYDPSLTEQALALVMPSPTKPIQVLVVNIPSETPTARQPSTPLPSKTASEAAQAVVTTEAPRASLTPTPSQQPSATQTQAVVPAPPTSAPTPLGGASGYIAFASDRSGTTQIWVMNSADTELRQLTDMAEGACQPSWSPDGMRIAFISPCERNQDQYKNSGIFIINWDGSGLTPLPSVGGGDFDPAWSPDGKQLAFASTRITGRPRIYLLDLETSEVTRISGQYSYDWQPAWSPDGSQIAFVTAQKGAIQIWTMNSDGSNQAVYTHSGSMINLHPEWSSDASVILFTQINQVGDIPKIVAASYTEDQYTEYHFELGPVPIRDARYSPDGLWMAFESWPAGDNHDIYIMAASGAGKIRLTDAPSFDFDPAWRPSLTTP
jgi:Tol biopolymer transport system component